MLGQRALRRAVRSTLLREASGLVAVRVIGFASSLLFNVLLARSAGSTGAGSYYLAFTVAATATVVAKIGIDNALLRFVASAMSTGDVRLVRGLLRAALHRCGQASIGVSLLLLVSAPLIASQLYGDDSVTAPIRVMALGLPGMVLSSVFGRALIGLGRTLFGSLIEGGALSVIQVVIFVVVFGSSGPVGAAAALSFGNVILVALGAVAWRQFGPASGSDLDGITTHEVAALFRASRALWWIAIFGVLSGFVGTVTLGVLATTAEAGVFAIGNRVAKLGALTIVAFNTALAPRMARLHELGDRSGLRRLVVRSVLGLASLSSILTAVLVLIAPYIADVLGETFDDSVTTIRILALAYGLNIATGPLGMALQMIGAEVALRRVSVTSMLVQIGLSITLVPRWGAEGAAVGTLAAIALNNALCAKSLRRRLV